MGKGEGGLAGKRDAFELARELGERGLDAHALQAARADEAIRARFAEEKRLWMESLNLCVSQGSREDDDWTFCPTNASVMDTGSAYANQSSPCFPYGPWSY